MVKSRIIFLRSELTVLKRKAQAAEILNSVKSQGTYLKFPTGEHSWVAFEPVKDSTDVTVHKYDEASSIPIELQPSIRMEIREAADKLWQVRKHYNAYWRQD